jgi:hypothetical protein
VLIALGTRVANAASNLPSARKGLASLAGAAVVQALLFVSAFQYSLVYVPERWTTHPVTCALGFILIFTTPVVFLSVYWVGPGWGCAS